MGSQISGLAYKEQVAGLQSQLAIEAHRFTQTKTAADELLVQLQGQQSYVMELAMINKAMQEEHTALVEQLRSELTDSEAQDARAEARHMAKIAAQACGTDEQLASMKAKSVRDLQSLQEEHTALVEQLRSELADSEQRDTSAEARHLAEMAAHARSTHGQLASVKAKHAQTLQSLQAEHENAVVALKSEGAANAQHDLEKVQGQLSQELSLHKSTAGELKELRHSIASLTSQFAKADGSQVEPSDGGLGDLQRLKAILLVTQDQLVAAQQQEAAASQHFAARLQKAQQLAEAEKSILRQTNASLEDRLRASDAAQAQQDKVMAALGKQLQAAKALGESLLGEVRSMQADNDNKNDQDGEAHGVVEDVQYGNSAATLQALQPAVQDSAAQGLQPAAQASAAQDLKPAANGLMPPQEDSSAATVGSLQQSADGRVAAQDLAAGASALQPSASLHLISPTDQPSKEAQPLAEEDTAAEALQPAAHDTAAEGLAAGASALQPPASQQPPKAKKKNKAARQAAALRALEWANGDSATATAAYTQDGEAHGVVKDVQEGSAAAMMGSLQPADGDAAAEALQPAAQASAAQGLAAAASALQPPASQQPPKAKKGNKVKARRQAAAVQVSELVTDDFASTPAVKATHDSAAMPAAQTQVGTGSLSGRQGGGPAALSPPPLAAFPPPPSAAVADPGPPIPAPTGPQKLASSWWSSRVKSLQRDSGLIKKQVSGVEVMEAVPDMPDYWWPADPALRKVGSGGQGSVYYAEKWWMDSATGKLKKRPAALKVVPCTTAQQRALLEREAANLRALSSQDVPAPYAPTLFDTCISVNDDSCQGTLAMSLVEGELLDEYMGRSLASKAPQQHVQTVLQTLKKTLQVLADLHSRGGRSFGDLKPENTLVAGKKLVLIDWCSSRDNVQGALEGAPNTLGYPSPEVTALGHGQQPSSPLDLDLHKDDVWAVGVMGLLWLSKKQNMPFGPTRQQAKRLASPQGLAEAKKSLLAQHDAWAKAYAQTGEGGLWPEQHSMLLEGVADPTVRSMAAHFFMAVLHPQPSQRVTAAEALLLPFMA